jgi:DNA replication and repair protein RecF
MGFTDIRLQNFRSYADASFELSNGVNIIVGPNASGKTNLLEAIMVLSLGRSYRVKDYELIQFTKPWARLDGHSQHGRRTIKLIQEQEHRAKKELIVDDRHIKRITIQKQVPVVLFEPNHLQLLHGAPELRRDYLDNLLEQFTPGYETLRKNYRRALQQRNAILKNDGSKDQLFVWNLRLSDLGGQLALHRQQLIDKVNKEITGVYQTMGGANTKVEVAYESSCGGGQYSTKLLHRLETHYESDQRRGFTSNGPHRDDMRVSLNGYDAGTSASRGEMRTLLLAFKVIELKLLEEDRGVKPLLLMDDVFSELDGSRRKALTEAISGYQTFITTTDADLVIHHFTETCHIIPTSI